MKLPIYQVDAFSPVVFGGNPAAVVPLPQWLPDDHLRAIAAENNLSETAFYLPDYSLRWFTPVAEVELCGHATLATAHVLFEHQGFVGKQITFQTRFRGNLWVERTAHGYRMDLPKDQPERVQDEMSLAEILGTSVEAVYRGREDFMAVVTDEQTLLEVRPDFNAMSRLNCRGVLVTARGTESDFVSRCFFPAYGVDEDPVTGSAHTLLTPYWAQELGKTDLTAIQRSARGGQLQCILQDDRVHLIGQAVTYLTGQISIA